MRELLINFPDIDIKNMKYEVWKIKLKFYRKFSNEAEVATLANSSIWYQSSSVVVHKCSLRATKVHSHIQYAEKSEMIERQYKYRCTGALVCRNFNVNIDFSTMRHHTQAQRCTLLKQTDGYAGMNLCTHKYIQLHMQYIHTFKYIYAVKYGNHSASPLGSPLAHP